MKFPSRFPGPLLALTAVSFGTAAAHAADAPRVAWGRAGVAYEQYRNDAYDCAVVGLSSDVDHSAPVETLRQASRQLDALDSRAGDIGSAQDPVAAGARYASEEAAIRAAARPEKQLQAVKQIMFTAAQQCMADHGYSRFALTEDQRSQWSGLEDVQERRVYLHKLASDAAVLEQQAQPQAK